MERDFKVGLGNPKKNFQKHFDRKNGISKSKREEKLALCRKTKENDNKLPTDNIIELIQTFPIKQFLNEPEPVRIVEVLLRLLKTEGIEAYYASSQRNEINDGPFLFQEGVVIQKLISLLRTSTNIPLLINVSHCLISISAHPECMIWTTKLLINNFVQHAIYLLEKCPNPIVKENLIWTLSNMILDGTMIRDGVMKIDGAKLLNLVIANIENNASVCIYFMCSLTKDNPIPNFELVHQLWEQIIDRVFTKIDNESLNYKFILESIHRVSAINKADDYRIFIATYKDILTTIMNHKNLLISADIVQNLTYTESIHELLIHKGVIQYFLCLFDTIDPRFRITGATGIRIMATSRFAINLLLKPEALNVIEKHFEYSQMHDMQVELKLILCQIVLTISKMGIVNTSYPILFERNIHKQITKSLSEQHDMTLLTTALFAIINLMKFDRKVMKITIEELGYLDRIESISMNCKNKGASEIAEQILDFF
jgi:hypothetical protein